MSKCQPHFEKRSPRASAPDQLEETASSQSKTPGFHHTVTGCLIVIALSGSPPVLANAEGQTWASHVKAGCEARADGKYQLSEQHFKEAIQIARRNNWTMRLSTTLEELGICYLYKRDFTAAEKTLRQAITMRGARSDTPSTASKLHALGQALMEEGKYDDAESAFKKAIEIFEQSPLRITDPVSTMISLGDCYRRHEKLDRSLEVLKRAQNLVIAAKKTNSFEGINCNSQLVETYTAMSNFAPARELAAKMIASTGGAEEKLTGYNLLTAVLTRQDRLTEARAELEKAMILWRQNNLQGGATLGRSAWELAHHFAVRGDEKNEEGVSSMAKILMPRTTMGAYWLGCIGDQLLVKHKWNQAADRYKESLDWYRELKAVEPALVKFITNYAMLMRSTGHADKAVELENYQLQVKEKLQQGS